LLDTPVATFGVSDTHRLTAPPPSPYRAFRVWRPEAGLQLAQRYTRDLRNVTTQLTNALSHLRAGDTFDAQPRRQV